jgi:arsenite methyltransferase
MQSPGQPMDFLGEIAEIQQQLARSLDMTSRRVRVLDMLGAAPGERVLEVGCGSGLYLREIGVAVGGTGHALGIDISEDQIRIAREHCADLTQVDVSPGDVLELPAGDQAFDASLSVQVLEYIVEIERALTELRRVTRPAGRFVNVATNWGALFWSGGEPELTSRVVSIWEGHAPHPNLPVGLPSLLESTGFVDVRQVPLTIINRHFHPNTFAHGAARLMAAFAMASGELGQEDVDRWLTSLEGADSKGHLFLSSVPILTTATCLG